MIDAKNILQHELIGLTAEVVGSTNPLSIGIQGPVVDETTHTLVVEHNSKEKRIFKKSSKMVFSLQNGKQVEVEGYLLEGKPWDRIKKKW